MEIGQKVRAHGREGRISTLREDGTVDIACFDGGDLIEVQPDDVEAVKEDTGPAIQYGRQPTRGSAPPPTSPPPTEEPPTPDTVVADTAEPAAAPEEPPTVG